MCKNNHTDTLIREGICRMEIERICRMEKPNEVSVIGGSLNFDQRMINKKTETH